MATASKSRTFLNSLLSFTTSRLVPSGRRISDEPSPGGRNGRQPPSERLSRSEPEPAPDAAGDREESGSLFLGCSNGEDLAPEIDVIKRSQHLVGLLEKIEKEIAELVYECKCKVVKRSLDRAGIKPIPLPKQETKIIGSGAVLAASPTMVRKLLSIMTDSVMIKSNFKCAYCGFDFLVDLRSFSLYTKDHLVPKSKGGTAALNNMIACCLSCNQLKDNEATITMKHARAVINRKRIAWQRTLEKVRDIVRDQDTSNQAVTVET